MATRGTCSWAEEASTEELNEWLDNDVDPDDCAHIMALTVVMKRLDITMKEVGDRVYPSEPKRKKTQAEGIMDIITGR